MRGEVLNKQEGSVWIGKDGGFSAEAISLGDEALETS